MQAAKTKVTIAGKIQDPAFEQCRTAAYYLKTSAPEVQFEVLGFFETQWEEYLRDAQNDKKGLFIAHKTSPLVFINENEYIGDRDSFMRWVLFNHRYTDNSKPIIYTKKASSTYKKMINDAKNREYVFMDVSIGNEAPVKVVFELFIDVCPKTCENFKTLCNGSFTNKEGKALSYANTFFHRVVKGAFIQGGNIGATGVKGGLSIYDEEFPDESYNIKHTAVGLLGMSKKGGRLHSNECQFYVTTHAPLSFLNGRYVVFGRVIQGMRVFRIIEKLNTENEKPLLECKVKACGIFKVGEKPSISSAKP